MRAYRVALMLTVFHFLVVPSVRSADLSADQLLNLIEQEEVHLKAGMTKAEVANLIGRPFNNQNQNVWIWSFDMNRADPKFDWRQYAQEGGMFLILALRAKSWE